MKIKVTFEKVFDSNEFYNRSTPEDLEDLTIEQFKDEIYDELDEDRYLIDDFKFEEIKEDDGK